MSAKLFKWGLDVIFIDKKLAYNVNPPNWEQINHFATLGNKKHRDNQLYLQLSSSLSNISLGDKSNIISGSLFFYMD